AEVEPYRGPLAGAELDRFGRRECDGGGRRLVVDVETGDACPLVEPCESEVDAVERDLFDRVEPSADKRVANVELDLEAAGTVARCARLNAARERDRLAVDRLAEDQRSLVRRRRLRKVAVVGVHLE